MALPIKVFEISDVVLRDTTTDVGAHNNRRLCAAYYANAASFEVSPCWNALPLAAALIQHVPNHALKVSRFGSRRRSTACSTASC